MTKRFELNPDLTCPELAGYKLPPIERRQEDEMKVESEKYGFQVPYNGSNEFYDKDAIKHFEAGYTKAREKFEFTESDVILAIQIAKDTEYYLSDILQSLRTPRHPIAIEVEMLNYRFAGYHPATNPDGTVKGRWVYE